MDQKHLFFDKRNIISDVKVRDVKKSEKEYL